MDEPLISIIVPIYKVEKYLDKCIESLVNQTYKNLEIILVDDGSPDNCPAMCDEWKLKDSRIVVIHKPNGGLSDARNVGMDIAKGEYIGFVDSDDYVHEKFIELLYYAIKINNVKLSACDIKEVLEDIEYVGSNHLNISINLLSAKEALHQISKGKGIKTVAWNKLYHRSLIQNERFEKGKYREDEFFTYRIIDKNQQIAFVENQLYFYLQRSGSIMSSISIKHLDFLEALSLRIKYYESRYPDLCLIDRISYCIACINYFENTFEIKNKDNKKIRKLIVQYRKEITFEISEYLNISFKNIIDIFFSRYFIHFYTALIYIKRRLTK